MIEGIASIGAIADQAPRVGQSHAAVGGAGFGDWVAQGLADVNQQLLTSQVDMQALASGETANLHQLMIKLEESRIAFQLMMQVRTRLLDAYQEVMRMQV